jgi:outer membrane protein insertion porin family
MIRLPIDFRALWCLTGILALIAAGEGQAYAQRKAPPAQENRSSAVRSAPVRFEVSSITFEGNRVLTTTELSNQMLTRETPGWLGKFLYNSISERMGRKNEYLDHVTFSSDLDRLRKYYVNHGFHEAEIDTQIRYDTTRFNADIRLLITEGRRAIIDTIEYHGLVYEPISIQEDLVGSPRIQKGDPFVLPVLEEEVNRVLTILRNSRYPNARYLRDSSGAMRYASTGNYRVVLSFRMGKQYRFGPVTVVQEIDSLRSPEPRADITDEIIVDHLDYAPGEFYGAHKIANSQVDLNRLGILELRSIKQNVPDPQDTSTTVPTTVTYLPRDRNELAPEVIVSDDNAAFNLGLGLGYTRRNFFGGARTASTRLRFRTQTIGAVGSSFDKNSDAVSTVDLTYEVQQPTVLTNKIRGTWSFGGIIDKQKPYLQYILRNKFGFTGRMAEFTTGYLDWTLEFVDLKLNSYFQSAASDPAQQLQLLRIQERQFNSILGFTIQRDKSNDLFSPSDGFIHSLTLEEAGILPVLLRNTFPNIPYTQFYRVMGTTRWYFDLSDHRFSILALKLKGGIEGKYGESTGDTSRSIPQTHRFFGGGSSSVRGWASRELIAGNEDPQLGGNLSLEGSVELRVNVLQSMRDGLLDKLWLVSFVDVGNIWADATEFNLKSVAIATGIGLRYDTFFGPFRIDWGFRVYNPGEVAGRQWITQRKFFGQTLKEGIFHFGIGHAF